MASIVGCTTLKGTLVPPCAVPVNVDAACEAEIDAVLPPQAKPPPPAVELFAAAALCEIEIAV